PSAPLPPPGFVASTSTYWNNTGTAVGPGVSTVTSTISVSGAGLFLHDVDLTTFLRHTFPDDLDVTLTSPAGTVVTITTDNGGTNDDVFNGTVWDDDADPGNPATFTTDVIPTSKLVTDTAYLTDVVKPTLVPEEPLAAFIGENPNGIWTITVSDD